MEKLILHEINELNNLDNKSIPERVLKFDEEFGEFSAEMCKLVGITHKPFDREHLIEEAADSLQCHLSIILHLCDVLKIDFSEILKMIEVKNQKWRNVIPKYTKLNENEQT